MANRRPAARSETLNFQLLLKSLRRPCFQKAAAAPRHPVPEACEIARRSPVLLSEGYVSIERPMQVWNDPCKFGTTYVGLERRGLSVQELLTRSRNYCSWRGVETKAFLFDSKCTKLLLFRPLRFVPHLPG